MRKKLFIVLAVILSMVLNTLQAVGATSVSRYTGKTYTHNSRFDSFVRVDGLDVSIYQKQIDWEKAKADGIDFAIVRVAGRGYGSAGKMYTDDVFITNLRNAKAAGVMVGVYFFSQAITELEAKAEAEFTARTLAAAGYGPKDLDMPLFMDYEFSGGSAGRLTKARLTKSAATRVAAAFCEEVIRLGYKPGIYANLNFLNNTIDGATLGKKYPIWIAQYYTTCNYTNDYVWWQYSSGGKVSGVNHSNDCNFWYIDPNPRSTVGQNTSAPVETDPFTGAPIIVEDTGGMTPAVPAATKSLVDATASLTGGGAYTYDQGRSFTPGVSVTYQGVTLTEGVDYKVRYVNNSEAGTAHAMILGMGDFTDYKLLPFTVKPNSDLSGLKAENLQDKTYTGFEVMPTDLKITDGRGKVLLKNLDYTWTSGSAVDAGTANIKIIFTGNYTGTKSMKFNILPGNQTITLPKTSAAVTVGSAPFNLKATPKFNAKLKYKSSDTKVATVSSDGTVTPLAAGTAEITVTSDATSNFSEAKALFNLKVSDKAVVEPGEPGVQTVTTRYTKYTRKAGDKSFNLKAATNGDGAITYTSSDEAIATVDSLGNVTPVGPGTAQITVKAAATDTYKEGIKIVTLVVKTGNELTDDEKARLEEERKRQEEAEKLAQEEAERNFRIADGVRATEIIDLKATQLTSKKIKLSWKKSASGYGVDCYQVWRSVKKSSGYVKIYTTSTGTRRYYANSKGIKPNTTYWYKIRGVREVNGENVYTPFTKISIKTKP